MKLINRTSNNVKCWVSLITAMAIIAISEGIKFKQSKYIGIVTYGYVAA